MDETSHARGEPQAVPAPAGDRNGLCERFEHAWRAGAGLAVGPFLETPEAAAFSAAGFAEQAALLRDLIACETRFRRLLGQTCRCEDLVARYPEHAETIAAALRGQSADPDSTAFYDDRSQMPAGESEPPNPDGTPSEASLDPQVQELGRQIVSVGLMTADEWNALSASLPEQVRAGGLHDVTAEWIRQGKLTEYQLHELRYSKNCRLVLGNYVILNRLGGGGMGEVYLARHRKMDRVIALKLLHRRFTGDASALRRFLEREVQAAAKLFHPNIVTAFDSDEANGAHFLAMEYVPGINLAEVVERRGKLTPSQAIGLILQAARGLEHMHAAGVVHRDIKPENLILSYDGVVKILDLGLIRFDDGAGNDRNLTRTGQFLGTANFMSVEQFRDARRADRRSDVYSLGCTLHYLLSGRPPFVGNPIRLAMAHLMSPIPSLTDLHPEANEALNAAFRKMLAKVPDNRYPTMSELLTDLEACGIAPEPLTAADCPPPKPSSAPSSPAEPQAEPAESPPPGPPPSAAATHFWWLDAAMLLLIAGILVWTFSSRSGPMFPEPAPVHAPPSKR